MLSKLKNIVDIDSERARVFGIRTDSLNRFKSAITDDWKGIVGFTVVAIVAFIALIAPLIVPHDPLSTEFQILQPPTIFGTNPIGTDSYGRDMLSRVLMGARLSLGIGIAAVTFGLIFGSFLGLFAGYYGGWVDDLLMRISDVFWALPWLLIAILLAAIRGQGMWNVVIAIGFAYIDDFARITRGEVLSVREEEYILSAKGLGLRDSSIILGEVVPNIIAPIIVQFTVFIARAMIIESTLSFLGIGVKPTTPTWGSLLGQSRNFIEVAWWLSVIPGMMIIITVLAINLFGDALRDAYDVKQEVGG